MIYYLSETEEKNIIFLSWVEWKCSLALSHCVDCLTSHDRRIYVLFLKRHCHWNYNLFSFRFDQWNFFLIQFIQYSTIPFRLSCKVTSPFHSYLYTALRFLSRISMGSITYTQPAFLVCLRQWKISDYIIFILTILEWRFFCSLNLLA